jgi:hypothetical protein
VSGGVRCLGGGLSTGGLGRSDDGELRGGGRLRERNRFRDLTGLRSRGRCGGLLGDCHRGLVAGGVRHGKL